MLIELNESTLVDVAEIVGAVRETQGNQDTWWVVVYLRGVRGALGVKDPDGKVWEKLRLAAVTEVKAVCTHPHIVSYNHSSTHKGRCAVCGKLKRADSTWGT